jgi:hypothetical protein
MVFSREFSKPEISGDGLLNRESTIQISALSIRQIETTETFCRSVHVVVPPFDEAAGEYVARMRVVVCCFNDCGRYPVVCVALHSDESEDPARLNPGQINRTGKEFHMTNAAAQALRFLQRVRSLQRSRPSSCSARNIRWCVVRDDLMFCDALGHFRFACVCSVGMWEYVLKLRCRILLRVCVARFRKLPLLPICPASLLIQESQMEMHSIRGSAHAAHGGSA